MLASSTGVAPDPLLPHIELQANPVRQGLDVGPGWCVCLNFLGVLPQPQGLFLGGRISVLGGSSWVRERGVYILAWCGGGVSFLGLYISPLGLFLEGTISGLGFFWGALYQLQVGVLLLGGSISVWGDSFLKALPQPWGDPSLTLFHFLGRHSLTLRGPSKALPGSPWGLSQP